MIPTELLEKIQADSENMGWLLTEKFVINLPIVGIEKEFEGLYSYYEFIYQQKNGFDEMPFLAECLESSKGEFTKSCDFIMKLINDYSNSKQEARRLYRGKYHINELDIKKGIVSNLILRNQPTLFTYNSEETILINDIAKKYSESVANNSFSSLISIKGKSSIEKIKGEYLIRKYLTQQTESIDTYSKIELESLDEKKKKIALQLASAEQLLQKHIEDSKSKSETYVEQIDALKVEKQTSFDRWFDESKTQKNKLKTDYEELIIKEQKEYNERSEELEKLFKEKLKLSEPAKYWEDRGKKMRTSGNWYLVLLIILMGVVVASLCYLMVSTPEQIYISFFEKDKSAAIRWSIIYISFVSFLAYAIRAVAKVMFSSFHLARDSDERHTLTYFYLSLLKDENNELNKEEKQLIMQSLFSRADTGLLKDDSSPTMPNDIIGKLFSK